MAKRFTASDKWKDSWFSDLDAKQKLFWLYLLDDCDCAGVWEKNFKAASFFIGIKVTEEWAKDFLRDRVIECNGNKWFIPKFVDFQYVELNENSNPHKSVIKQLRKYGLYEGYLKGTYTLKDKEQEQDKVKHKVQVQVQDKGKEQANSPPDKPLKLRHGENVLLTESEYGKLIERFGSEARTKKAIEILDNAISSKGYKYKSHYHTIIGWVEGELIKREKNHGTAPAIKQSEQSRRASFQHGPEDVERFRNSHATTEHILDSIRNKRA